MDALRQIAPAHEVGAGAVDTGKIGVVPLLRYGGIDVVADGHKAGGQQPHAALGAGEEVLQHLVVGPPRLLRHLAVAHGCHDKAVLHRQLIDLDGRKQRRVGIQRLRHAGGASLSILAVRAHPVTEAVHQLLYQNILFQEIVLTFLFDLHALYSDSSIAYSSCRINKKDGEKANHSLQPATFYGRMMLVI